MGTILEHKSYLNFYPNVSPPVVINVGQYDDAFTISFYPVFVNKGIVPRYPVPVTLPEEQYMIDDNTGEIASGLTAEVRGTKLDGNGYSASVTRNYSNTAWIVSGDKQMTAIAGENIFELVVYSGDDEISSANFILNVERAALDNDTIVSDSVVRELLDVIDQAEDIIAAAQQILNAIDATLTQQGKAADAKAVGDALANLSAYTYTDANHDGHIVITAGGGT